VIFDLRIIISLSPFKIDERRRRPFLRAFGI
jgi:hypothetical protein